MMLDQVLAVEVVEMEMGAVVGGDSLALVFYIHIGSRLHEKHSSCKGKDMDDFRSLAIIDLIPQWIIRCEEEIGLLWSMHSNHNTSIKDFKLMAYLSLSHSISPSCVLLTEYVQKGDSITSNLPPNIQPFSRIISSKERNKLGGIISSTVLQIPGSPVISEHI
ncbi:hypothetical protein BDB01DRAFT_835311 [Pilobolus umbonatus]|nr:hypothetical protein BDB01DRAFT_835311 [Pilobolus umbonatus]